MCRGRVSVAVLKFTSHNALRRSIRQVYPNLTEEQQEATYQTMKSKVGWWRDKEGDWHPPEDKK